MKERVLPHSPSTDPLRQGRWGQTVLGAPTSWLHLWGLTTPAAQLPPLCVCVGGRDRCALALNSAGLTLGQTEAPPSITSDPCPRALRAVLLASGSAKGLRPRTQLLDGACLEGDPKPALLHPPCVLLLQGLFHGAPLSRLQALALWSGSGGNSLLQPSLPAPRSGKGRW